MLIGMTAQVRTARDDNRLRLFDILSAAFVADPAVRWMYPGARQYQRFFPRFAAALAGGAIEHGTADWITDGAAALWLPPNVGPDECALSNVIAESVPDEDRSAVLTLLEEMSNHRPSEPHWYLPLIGVVPELQGRGLGSDLLTLGLARCDSDRYPAYLESTNPDNISLYRRYGFDVAGRIEVPSSPPIIPMLRQPGRTV